MTINTSIYLPAFSNNSLSFSSSSILVTEIVDNTSVLIDQELTFGQCLLFNTGVEGIYVRNKKVHVIGSIDSIEYAYTKESNNSYAVRSSKLIDDELQYGTLKAKCNVPTLHRAGLLGWSLYLNDTLVAVGNDYSDKGYCLLNGNKDWEAGTYELKVTLFHKDIIPIKQGSKRWTITKSINRLSCGGFDDNNPMIELY